MTEKELLLINTLAGLLTEDEIVALLATVRKNPEEFEKALNDELFQSLERKKFLRLFLVSKKDIVGTTFSKLKKQFPKNNFRISSVNGKFALCTRDYIFDRLNLDVEQKDNEQVVVSCHFG